MANDRKEACTTATTFSTPPTTNDGDNNDNEEEAIEVVASTSEECDEVQKEDVSAAASNGAQNDEVLSKVKDERKEQIMSNDDDDDKNNDKEGDDTLKTTSVVGNQTKVENNDYNDDNNDDNNNMKASPSLLDDEEEEDDDDDKDNENGDDEDTKDTNGFVVVEEESAELSSSSLSLDPEKLRVMEEMHIGTATDILFPENNTNAGTGASATASWDNLRWMSLSGCRKVAFSRIVFRRVKEQTMVLGLFKSKINYTFPSRLLVLYQYPPLLLVLRRAVDLQELSHCTAIDFSNNSEANPNNNNNNNNNNPDAILQHYWIAESVVELATCKLQLSALTTHEISLIFSTIHHDREPSAFWIQSPSLSPNEQIILSAVQQRPKLRGQQTTSFSDSGAFLETTSTEHSIVQAICQAYHGMHEETNHSEENDDDEDLTWKHQIILGTLHSLVLSGNVKALEEAMERAWTNGNQNIISNKAEAYMNLSPNTAGIQKILPSRIIDATDDSGRPALYYACKQGMNDAMALLIRYGAKVDYTTPNGNSLLHICARHLNDTGLTTLLTTATTTTASSTGMVNVNGTNTLGHTPLYHAIVNGTRAGGRHDPLALERCIQAFKAYGGSLFGSFVIRTTTQQQHPLLELALQYRWKDLAVFLEFLDLDYPLTGNMDVSLLNNHVGSSVGVIIEESLSVLHGYPLHRVLAHFRNQIISGVSFFNNNNKENIVGTIKILLQCGFEVNERIDLAAFCNNSKDETGAAGLVPWIGFAPIQILAATALELENIRSDLDESVYASLNDSLSQLCEELVRNGARLSLESPPLERKRQKPSLPQKQASSHVSPSVYEESTSYITHTATKNPDRTINLKLDTNEQALRLLGGRERLKKAQTAFAEMGGCLVKPNRAPRRDDNSNIADSNAPGGNNERSCAICWKPFGTIVNRKHRCRISWRHLCDDCSSKRIVVQGKEYRVGDGQFVRAKVVRERNAGYDAWKNNYTSPRAVASSTAGVELPSSLSSTSSATTLKTSHSGLAGGSTGGSSGGTSSNLARIRQQRLDDEKANRDSLFDQATDFLFGTTDEDKRRSSEHSSSMNGLMNSLGETRNALLERGDKLSSLDEKTDKLVSASEDFAKLATELRKQSERGLFW